MILLLCKDNEICGKIYAQFCYLISNIVIDEKDKTLFIEILSSLMHKLSAVRYHLKRYFDEEKNEFHNCKKRFAKDPNVCIEAFELIFEFESFLFQVKSALDILAKLLNVAVGEGIIATTTFGDKGQRIINGLEQLKRKKRVKLESIDALINLIQTDKEQWLAKIIEFRDELNHIKALQNYYFKLIPLPNGQRAIEKPKFKGIETVPLMETITQNVIDFSQDFMCLAFDLKVPRSFKLVLADIKNVEKDFDKFGKYIKYMYILEIPEKA